MTEKPPDIGNWIASCVAMWSNTLARDECVSLIVSEFDPEDIIPRYWSEDIWKWYNLTFDAVALISIFIISIILLILIELNVCRIFDWMPRIGYRKTTNKLR